MTEYTHFSWNAIGMSGRPYPVAHTSTPPTEAESISKRQIKQLHKLTDADRQNLAEVADGMRLAFLAKLYPYLDPDPVGPPLVTIHRQVVRVSGQEGSSALLPAEPS